MALPQINRDLEMQTLPLVYTWNSKWMVASFLQCNIFFSSLSPRGILFSLYLPHHSEVTLLCFFLCCLCPPHFPCLAYTPGFFPPGISCTSIPSPWPHRLSLPSCCHICPLFRSQTLLNPLLCFIAGSSVAFKYLCPYILCLWKKNK